MIMGAIIGHKSIVRVARELSVRPSPTDISDGEEQCHIIVLLLLRTGTAICKHNPVTCKFQTKQGQQFCESTCGKWGREQAIGVIYSRYLLIGFPVPSGRLLKLSVSLGFK